MSWSYTEKTTELFMNAVQGKPGTHLGEIKDPDGIGEHGSISCGDALRFTFRVEQHETDPRLDRITEARYLTFGCTSAIAASEALCCIIEEDSYTPIEALKITNEDIVKYLGGLPQAKIHCSVMGAEALEAAVFNWAQRRGVDLTELGVDIRREEQEEGRIVCSCFGLTEPYLRRKIKELNLKSITDIINTVKAGGGCMTCHHSPGGLQDLLDEAWGRPTGSRNQLPVLPQLPTVIPNQDSAQSQPQATGLPPGLSPYKFAKKVEEVLDSYVRPQLSQDGGDIEIIDIKDATVYCRLTGACASCVSGDHTIKLLVEQALKDRVSESARVIAI
jgi:NifU-like protein